MEFIGNNIFDETELQVRMPKFGNIKNMQNYDIVATCEKKEHLIKTKLRNQTPENDNGIPYERMYEGIFDLLSLHPCPRYCGPFTGPIVGHWNPSLTITDSNDSVRNFQYFVTFTHSASQACGTWTYDEEATVTKNKPIFKVETKKNKLSGPASTWSKSIIYPCEKGQCCIECPCNLCTSREGPCGQYCAKSPCKDCDKQCIKHKCELDRTYSRNDSFTIPFFFQTLEEVKAIGDSRKLAGTGCDPERNFIKYAGVPRSCTDCQEDLLDHEMHHSVLHYLCKFCRKSLRILKNEPLNGFQILEEKSKIESTDNLTCSYCYKYFASSTRRKYHEKTEHTGNDKPFPCKICQKSFASLVGLNPKYGQMSDQKVLEVNYPPFS